VFKQWLGRLAIYLYQDVAQDLVLSCELHLVPSTAHALKSQLNQCKKWLSHVLLANYRRKLPVSCRCEVVKQLRKKEARIYTNNFIADEHRDV